jgi:F0F1-type ATP synthase membrane subunit a
MTVKYIEQMLQEPLQRMKKQVFLQNSSYRFFNYKTVVSILIAALLMVLLFSSLAKSYAKNGGIAKDLGVFEPLVVYIRDEIAIPNIRENYKRYMSYLLTIFFLCIVFKYLWIDATLD